MTRSISPPVRRRERDAILQSLRAGVVPRIGLQHVQVGRKAEVAAIIQDLERVSDGGSAIRFVIGRFGAGKSFFLNLVQTVALEQRFVVARADITTDRRFHGSRGQARAMAAELMKNLATKARPDGAAMPAVIERWISTVSSDLEDEGASPSEIERAIVRTLSPLHDLVGGFEFSEVLARYYRAYAADDDGLKQAAVRWLRAEFGTKTEAREALGVRKFIDDASFYDYLKLWAAFSRIAGYSGLIVGFDELVVLSHRLSNRQARNANYEQVLRMLNDCLQGHVEGLMLLFCGTDEALEDRRRGLYSYEALATRLAPNEFAGSDRQDLSGPLIRLPGLTAEDLFVLLQRIRHVHASGGKCQVAVPDEAIETYLEYCSSRLGASYFQTPRDAVTRFVGLLGVLENNPALDWRAALNDVGGVSVPPSESCEATAHLVGDDALTSFTL